MGLEEGGDFVGHEVHLAHEGLVGFYAVADKVENEVVEAGVQVVGDAIGALFGGASNGDGAYVDGILQDPSGRRSNPRFRKWTGLGLR